MRLIFVVGCGHSGTSLLTIMLGTHSKIFAINKETGAFLRNRSCEAYSKLLRDDGHLDEAERKGAEFVCEKTPSHINHMGRIRDALPDCSILSLVRDPRDVCLSIMKRTGSLEEGVARWVKENTKLKSRLEHKQDVFLIRYEDLVMSPETILSSVCLSVGLQYEEAMLLFHQDDREWFGVAERRETSGVGGRRHRMLRNWQIHQPLSNRSRLWERELEREKVQLVEASCGPLMEFFGYEKQA